MELHETDAVSIQALAATQNARTFCRELVADDADSSPVERVNVGFRKSNLLQTPQIAVPVRNRQHYSPPTRSRPASRAVRRGFLRVSQEALWGQSRRLWNDY